MSRSWSIGLHTCVDKLVIPAISFICITSSRHSDLTPCGSCIVTNTGRVLVTFKCRCILLVNWPRNLWAARCWNYRAAPLHRPRVYILGPTGDMDWIRVANRLWFRRWSWHSAPIRFFKVSKLTRRISGGMGLRHSWCWCWYCLWQALPRLPSCQTSSILELSWRLVCIGANALSCIPLEFWLGLLCNHLEDRI